MGSPGGVNSNWLEKYGRKGIFQIKNWHRMKLRSLNLFKNWKSPNDPITTNS